MPELYRIRIKRGDLEVEVESSDRDYVEAKLEHYLNAQRSSGPSAADSASGSGADVSSARSRPLIVREFVKQVNPEKKNEVAATIAYFLEYHAEQPVEEWRLEDVGDKFADARKSRPANMRDLLVKSDYFMEGREKGTYRLSETGVNWVEGQLNNHEG
jgi:hypothetical protein